MSFTPRNAPPPNHLLVDPYRMIDPIWYQFFGKHLLATDNDGTILITQEGLHEPTLLNSWSQKATYETVGFWKDSCGMVHLQGAITGGTAVAHTPLFVLPTGYLPTNTLVFADAAALSRLYIDTASSELRIMAGTPTDVYFDGLSFRAYA